MRLDELWLWRCAWRVRGLVRGGRDWDCGGWKLKSGGGGGDDDNGVDDEWKAWGACNGAVVAVVVAGAGAGARACTELKKPDPDLLLPSGAGGAAVAGAGAAGVTAVGVTAIGDVTTIAPVVAGLSLLPPSLAPPALPRALRRPLSASVVTAVTVLAPESSPTPDVTAPKGEEEDSWSGTAWVSSAKLESISFLSLGSGGCFKSPRSSRYYCFGRLSSRRSSVVLSS
ncbi:hypothetical protein RRF57_007712 [Xylaria bambusicola]|uniref:Uncharacterized protein n=1 Tax=Xylaria bambusicola TaxID=326684 RepID=A0AAN7USF2_9PEZI